MQRLADELSISPGNLTYHFPKKEDLMLAIYELFQYELAVIVPSSGSNQPDLFQLDEQMQSFYQLQQRFLFFYLDLLEIERSYESIAEKHYKHIKVQISAIKSGLEYNVRQGSLRKVEDQATYEWLAQQIWFTAVFWPQQIKVRGIENNPENLRQVLWYQIKPFLSTSGSSQVKSILDFQKSQPIKQL